MDNDKRLELIEDSVVVIREKVEHLAIDSAENKIQLKEHMRRSESNEENNKLLQTLIEEHRKEFNKKLSPLQVFVDRFKFLIYVIGVAASCLLFLVKLGVMHF